MKIEIGITSGITQPTLFEFRHPKISIGRNPLNDVVLSSTEAIGVEATLEVFWENHLPICFFVPSKQSQSQGQRWTLIRERTRQPLSQKTSLQIGDKVRFMDSEESPELELLALKKTGPANRTISIQNSSEPPSQKDIYDYSTTLADCFKTPDFNSVVVRINQFFQHRFTNMTHFSIIRQNQSDGVYERVCCVDLNNEFIDEDEHFDVKLMYNPEVTQKLSLKNHTILHYEHQLDYWTLLLPVPVGFVVSRFQKRPGDDEIRHFGVLLELFSPSLSTFLKILQLEEEKQALIEENRYFRERERRHYLFKEIVAQSPKMKAVYSKLNHFVGLQAPVLIIGEAGTGKELLARAFHHLGPRSSNMMISQKCGDIEEQLLDFELFGYSHSEAPNTIAPRQGLIELVDGGTLFLDEIELLSLRLQAKILRVIKEGEVRRIGESEGRIVDVRFITSTNKDLAVEAKQGLFRQDLWFTLNHCSLNVPLLKNRQEDIIPLATIFLQTYTKRYGKDGLSLSREFKDWLIKYSWPGNVRELQGVIETSVITAKDNIIKSPKY